MTRPVRRADRIRDVVAMAVLLTGAALYAYAYGGMHLLADRAIVPVPGHSALERFDRYWQLSRAGLLLMAVGVATVAWSFWRFRSRPPAQD